MRLAYEGPTKMLESRTSLITTNIRIFKCTVCGGDWNKSVQKCPYIDIVANWHSKASCVLIVFG